jgi:hypothetical protein
MEQTVIVTYPDFETGKNQKGKFLHLRFDGRAYLVFASQDQHRYHNQILAHFLADQGIACHWSNDMVLQVDEPKLCVDGGGRFQLDGERLRLTLSDNSQAYGRFDERRVRKGIASAEGEWSRFKVSITD